MPVTPDGARHITFQIKTDQMNLARNTFLILALAGPAFLQAADKPNVVIILGDDMGYADLHSYNPESKIPTPALDRLAEQGMRFTDAHTTGSTCIPARFGLITGTYPFRQPSMGDSKPLIPKDMPTVASLLKTAGYSTHMVGKWHLGFVDKKNPVEGQPLVGGPMDRGFDSFFGIHASTDIPPYYYIEGRLPQGLPMKEIAANNDDPDTGWNHIQGAFWRKGGIGQDLSLPEVTPKFCERAAEVVKQQATTGKPFFLYLALPSPHTPWLPTDAFVGKSGAGSYGDFLMTVDHGIGRVLDQIDDSGITDSTLVIFTSDNGPVWYGKDEERFGHTSTGVLRGMKGDNWEGGHRMPFIVRYPHFVAKGSTSDALISFLDVSATLSELAGVTVAVPSDSVSFLPVLLGKTKNSARKNLVHGKKNRMTIRKGKWKLLDHLGSAGFSRDKGDPKKDPPGQLYNLSNDLGEQKNLWREMPEKVEQLRAEMRSVLKSKLRY